MMSLMCVLYLWLVMETLLVMGDNPQVCCAGSKPADGGHCTGVSCLVCVLWVSTVGLIHVSSVQ